MSRHPVLGRHLAALLLFSLATVVVFHSLVLHPGSRVACCTSDGTSTLRDYWAADVQHRNPFTFTHDALNGAPQGVARTPATLLANGGVQTAFVWSLRGPLGLIGAWNAFLFLGMIATGVAMFALLDRLGCGFVASLFGAYVFAFSPYALERAYAGHLGLLQNWVLVLVVAGLLGLRERRSLPWAAGVGAAIALAFYVAAYQGLLAGFAALVLLLVELVRLRGAREWARTAWLGAAACLVTGLALIPVLILYARERSTVQAEVTHRVVELSKFAAKTTAYLLPSPRNPLFHWLRGAHPLDLTEETLFFGYTTYLLAIAAVILLWRRDRWLQASGRRRSAALFFAVLVPAALLMSLPPRRRVGSGSIPMPSSVLAHISTFWRVYSRFGLLVGLGAAVLAAFALTALGERPGRYRRLLAPVALLVVFLELLPGNVKAFDTSARPGWVAWLAAQPRGIIANYPTDSLALGTADYWYQSLDGDPLFEIIGGSDITSLSRDVAIRLAVEDFGDPHMPGILVSEGVRYVVVHDDVYRAEHERLPRPSRRYYTLLGRFGSVRIYSVHAPRVNISAVLQARRFAIAARQGLAMPSVTFGAGFDAPEKYFDATSRWMINDGALEIDNSEGAIEVTLTGTAFTNQQPRLLEVQDSDGRVLARERITTQQVPLHLGPFRIPSGRSSLLLHATPGPVALGPSDPRLGSVFLIAPILRPTAVFPPPGQ